MSFIEELKRRNVVRVGLAYAVVAWLLLQLADVVLNNISAPDWVFGSIMLVLILGFPLVLIFAWVFEMTPEGLKKETEIDRSQSITHSTGRKLDFVIMGLMAAALVYFAWDKFGPGAAGEPGARPANTEISADIKESAEETVEAGQAESASTSPRSIAVLPFVDMSPEKDQEYLSDGIAEELLNLLAKIPDLQVAARTSSFSFKGKDVKIADIAKELNVAAVLEGSLRKSGNRVRITTQLIQADNGFHLWSETYDRNLDDVFAIQDEISAAVVDALKIQLLGAAPKSVEVNPDAYALYLQGRYFRARRTQGDIQKAGELYEQALQLDPTYAPAWAAVSQVYAGQAGQSYIDLHQGYVKARQAAQKALDLDPALVDGWVALSGIQSAYDWDWDGANASLSHALELAPGNVDAIIAMGYLQRVLGNLDQAIVLFRRAVELDPVTLGGYHSLGLALIYAGELDEADEVYQHLLAMNPQFTHANLARARVMLLKGRPEEALAISEKEAEPFWREYGILVDLYALGRTDEADARLAPFIEQNQQDSAYQIAQIYGFRGDQDKVFEWLERAYAQRDGGLPELLYDPFLKPFNTDPRWIGIVRKVGLLDAWEKLQSNSQSN
jgi:TolB-like protein/Tfp pilus assembly protein PilF